MRASFSTTPFANYITAPEMLVAKTKNQVYTGKIRAEDKVVDVFGIDTSPRHVINTLVGHVCAAAIARADRTAEIETPRFFVRLNKEGEICGFATEAVTFDEGSIAEHSANRSLSASPSLTSLSSGSCDSTESLNETSTPPPTLFKFPTTWNTQRLIHAGLGYLGAIRVVLRDADGGGNLLFNRDYTRIAQIDFEHANGIKRAAELYDLLNFSNHRLKRLAFLLASPFMASDEPQDHFDWMCHQGIDYFNKHMIELLKNNPDILKIYFRHYLRGLKAGIAFFEQENIVDRIANAVGLGEYLAQEEHQDLRKYLEKTVSELQQHNLNLAALLEIFPTDDEEIERLMEYVSDMLAVPALHNTWIGPPVRGEIQRELTEEERTNFNAAFHDVIIATAGCVLKSENTNVLAEKKGIKLVPFSS